MLYNLKSLLNRTNNPSSDGLFELGFINISDPDYPIGFNRFTNYGYTDGTSVDFNALNTNKLLAWHKAGNADIHTGIAFENLSSSLIQQPFNSAEMLYANLASGVLSNGRKDICVRLHISKPSLLELEGIIHRTTYGCSSQVGYKIVKNGDNIILPYTELVTTTNPVPFSITEPLALAVGDFVDIVIESSNDNSVYCDTIGFNTIFNLVQADVTEYLEDDVLVDVQHSLDLATISNCDTGVTTFELVNGSATNVTINSFNTSGTITYTPTAVGTFGFTYRIKCDGEVIGTVLLRGVSYCVPINAQIVTSANSVLASTVTYSTSPLTAGAWTVNNGASIVSGQGTGAIVVQLPNTIKKITATFTYTDCHETVVRTRIIAMTRPACIGDC
jgi:hypothetical protein